MKIALIAIGVLVLLVVGVVAIGAMLPKRHVATRSAVYKSSPEKLYALIAGDQSWRPDVNSCELFKEGEKQFERETSKNGGTITYELQDATPPVSLVRRIATENLPFGGSWKYAIEPVNGATRVTITEDGEIYNPIFRFVSKFVMGQTATQDAYLKAMGKATGEVVRIDE